MGFGWPFSTKNLCVKILFFYLRRVRIKRARSIAGNPGACIGRHGRAQLQAWREVKWKGRRRRTPTLLSSKPEVYIKYEAHFHFGSRHSHQPSPSMICHNLQSSRGLLTPPGSACSLGAWKLESSHLRPVPRFF